ncbi:hypothetical protein COO91_01099 [Nostoc flagelliforme CCNUN1]|uniref:Uncharacterized protein n=1 Tax=Nostoc flagelliforme CCNUN1 TaxID=2038116 RepID=A0A2K8SIH6_9NOSO|nr:hypothetical protein COO91_01099 [Nostoc flagelliforme CCNUN1]
MILSGLCYINSSLLPCTLLFAIEKYYFAYEKAIAAYSLPAIFSCYVFSCKLHKPSSIY